MALELLQSEDDWLVTTATPITGYPLSISAWCRVFTDGTGWVIAGVYDQDSGQHFHQLRAAFHSGGDPAECSSMGGSGQFKKALSSTGMSLNTWHHVLGSYTQNTLREVWLDGAGHVQNTSGTTPTGLDRLGIGKAAYQSPSHQIDGQIAHVAFWDAALGADDAAVLAAGYSPLFVKPANLVAYYPLYDTASPSIDIVGGYNATWQNTPAVSPSDPPVRMPVLPILGQSAGAAPPGLSIPVAMSTRLRQMGA